MEDGYPTDKELKTIKNWPHKDGWHGLMQYLKERWQYPDYFRQDRNIYEVSTGGWSGHEEMIRALEENLLFWGCCWWSSRRGGHYEFKVRG